MLPNPALAPAPSASFKDVPPDYWAYEYISGLAQFNVISGFSDGTFKPNEAVTRAQFAAILNQAFMSAQPFQVPNGRLNATQPGTPAFADVPNNHWAAGYIAKARAAGFLSGYPGNQFRPNQPISRVQALVSIASGLGYQGGNMAELSAYKDAAAIPEYARFGLAVA
ncbi:MAG: S-layer homology domain-containing protein, partial [Nodosilinea sp.]